ncbi:LacI family DNA-binding transcriptional regulator [Algibacillus agarilyticus]|uniref:LacI family DNA-binding transcriptional regulator n=1 Tax=Algibacillus agarilyticus TaxID=2234133 RepID=UPI000DCFD6FD|nr:LacI family DNA-binding transcriptional regulator [Algibacillus agarilyticus]
MKNSGERSTIQDVAKLAGVSTMTVSRALAPNASISIKSRLKVESAINELNYRPNVSARRLASDKSFFIGLLYDNPSAAYVSQFISGAMRKCRRLGFHLVVDECNGDDENILATAKNLQDELALDGAILLPPLCDNVKLVDYLLSRSISVVRIAPDIDINRTPYICINDYEAAFKVTEHLIKLGHHKIAFIKGDPKIGASRLRLQGYIDAMHSQNLTIADEYIQYGAFTYKSGLIASANLLNLSTPPTAIFAANDDMASAAIATINRLGFSVPEDISVVGFDDSPIATTMWPSLSTVQQPMTDMSEKAIELFSQGKINPEALTTDRIRNVLNFTIMQRESIAPAPALLDQKKQP